MQGLGVGGTGFTDARLNTALERGVDNIKLDNTTNAEQTGVVYKGSAPYIHNFNYGDNGTVTTSGSNLFVGVNAGNLTMGSTATETYHASYNNASGTSALYSNTTGHSNNASGTSALRSNTTGHSNNASGTNALYSNTTGHSNNASGTNALRSNTTGYYNSASGTNALYSNTTGHSNNASGTNALRSNTTGYYNSASGRDALYSNTTGHSNNASGRDAGRYIADGSTPNETGSFSVFVGHNTRANADGETNQVVIGASAIGLGSNTAVVGNSSTTLTKLFGALRMAERSADPPDPPEGEGYVWISDGTGSGDDGDFMIKITAGSTTKTGPLFDHSAA